MELLVDDLLDCMALQATHIAFPDLAFPVVMQLRRFVNHSKDARTNRALSQLAEKVSPIFLRGGGGEGARIAHAFCSTAPTASMVESTRLMDATPVGTRAWAHWVESLNSHTSWSRTAGTLSGSGHRWTLARKTRTKWYAGAEPPLVGLGTSTVGFGSRVASGGGHTDCPPYNHRTRLQRVKFASRRRLCRRTASR